MHVSNTTYILLYSEVFNVNICQFSVFKHKYFFYIFTVLQKIFRGRPYIQ